MIYRPITYNNNTLDFLMVLATFNEIINERAERVRGNGPNLSKFLKTNLTI